MEKNRPRGRERNTSDTGKGVQKKGAVNTGSSGPAGRRNGLGGLLGGLGGAQRTGSQSGQRQDTDRQPAGGQSGQGFPQQRQSYGSYGGGRSRGGSKIGCLGLIVILVIVMVLFRGGGLFSGLGGLTGGGSSSGSGTWGSGENSYSSVLQSGNASGSAAYTAGSGYKTGWTFGSNNGVLNTNVSETARPKYTAIKGDGTDTTTIMVYMCGTDLESKAAMASRDLQEMAEVTYSDNVHVIVYTGGCTQWQNSIMSNSVNQIYEVRGGGVTTLEKNAGKGSMTDPDTLASFIKWTAKNYPANRMDLIFWDHGGGSLSGYGYDQRNPKSGSMTPAQIDKALEAGGITFDFVGFDACLMATAETGLMLSDYADYMIASEEVEPGIGWYYTNWLTQLSRNPSMDTLSIGKTIVDDFTAACARNCNGQQTTLSVVDLAELSETLPAALVAFAEDTSAKIENGSYKPVSAARANSHEFARSTKIDQVDLTHFADLVNSKEGKALAQAVVNAVKYNKVSSGLSNAYGLSIYFPYQKLSQVDSASNTYEAIGMESSYTSCIKHFAQMQVGGQAASGGNASPFWSLLENAAGQSTSGGQSSSGYGNYGGYSGSTYDSQEAIMTLLQALLSGAVSDYGRLGLDGLDRSNTAFLSEDPVDASAAASFIFKNSLSAEDLAWQENMADEPYISLTDAQWDLVERVDMNLLFDDGEGYIDLGCDNIYDFDEDGNLLPVTDGTWISIDGQPVSYYHLDTYEEEDYYRITGRVPVLLNGDEADLILVFDTDNPHGYVAGARYGYSDLGIETSAKSLETLNEGDEILFICDYYDYDGNFLEKHYLATYTVTDMASMSISNTPVGEAGDTVIVYSFTDIYGKVFYTPAL